MTSSIKVVRVPFQHILKRNRDICLPLKAGFGNGERRPIRTKEKASNPSLAYNSELHSVVP